MSSEKKRDVAKDLVDFLLNESKKPAEATLTERVKKTASVPTEVVSKDSEDTKSVPDLLHQAYGTPDPSGAPLPNESPRPERGKLIFNEVSKLMGGVEAIKVAQARIQELEKERDQLRNHIDELLVSSESLQRQISEAKSELEKSERRQKQRFEISAEEKVVMQERLVAREKELSSLKKINEEMEKRFLNDLQKIRVREKEFENKNAILKAENVAVGRAKDDMILDLKRKIDQFQFEIDNYKTKFSQTDAVMNEMREREVRAIKALRLALNILETDDFEETTQVNPKLKKAVNE